MGAIAYGFLKRSRNEAFDGIDGHRASILLRDRRPDGAGAGRILRLAGEAAAETLWPTRCVACDRPGELLCARCRLQLPYIDRNLACPRCGSPHGARVCVDCNTFSLSQVGCESPPFERCVSAIEHRRAARTLVTSYKDQGERRLANVMAGIVADALPRAWADAEALAYVPADRLARRRRGFDHMELLAGCLQERTGIPRTPLLEKRAVKDQRGLDRHGRFRNMAGAIRVSPAAPAALPASILLVDDVYTTGATLFAACDALHAAGAKRILCATFARVP